MHIVSHDAEPAEDKPQEAAPEGTLRSRADHFIRAAQQKLGMNTGFMQSNYTRVASVFRVIGDGFVINSGKQHHTPARMAGASLAIGSAFLGLIFKQRKQSPEELEALDKMPKGKYIALRLKQAFQPKEHIRQTLSVSMMIGTVLHMIAAVRSKRFGEGFLGAVGFLSANILCFTREDNKAWRNQTALQSVLSTPIGAGYAVEAIRKGDNNIPVAMSMHTASHAVSFLATYGHKEGEKETQPSQSQGR